MSAQRQLHKTGGQASEEIAVSEKHEKETGKEKLMGTTKQRQTNDKEHTIAN